MQLSIGETKNDLVKPYHLFKFSIRSELTRKYYERRITRFFDFIEFNPGIGIEQRFDDFAQDARSNADWVLNKIITFLQFQKERTEKREITPATLSNFVKALKILCEISDVTISWKKITRGLPRPSLSANDRAPTISEIKKIIDYPDRRIKPIIYTMVSSGIRIGAWNSLQWKHISPIHNDIGEVVAAKMIVYAGDVEEYYCYISPTGPYYMHCPNPTERNMVLPIISNNLLSNYSFAIHDAENREKLIF